MLVQFGADRAQMPGLPRAEQIAGAAQVEVGRADRHAGAEAGQRLHRREPAARRLGQPPARLGQEIGRAAPARPRPTRPRS